MQRTAILIYNAINNIYVRKTTDERTILFDDSVGDRVNGLIACMMVGEFVNLISFGNIRGITILMCCVSGR